MKRDMPFKVPILLDEMYVFNHKTGNMATAKAYVDVANNVNYHILSIVDKRGNIRTAKLNMNPKVFKERRRKRGDRTTRSRDKISGHWFDEIQHKLHPGDPIQVFTWNRKREKVRVIASLNKSDTSETFIRVGDEVSVIVKEKNPSNWIMGLILGAVYDYVEGFVMDIIQGAIDAAADFFGIDLDVELEFEVNLGDIDITIDVKLEAGGYGD